MATAGKSGLLTTFRQGESILAHINKTVLGASFPTISDALEDIKKLEGAFQGAGFLRVLDDTIRAVTMNGCFVTGSAMLFRELTEWHNKAPGWIPNDIDVCATREAFNTVVAQSMDRGFSQYYFDKDEPYPGTQKPVTRDNLTDLAMV